MSINTVDVVHTIMEWIIQFNTDPCKRSDITVDIDGYTAEPLPAHMAVVVAAQYIGPMRDEEPPDFLDATIYLTQGRSDEDVVNSVILREGSMLASRGARLDIGRDTPLDIMVHHVRQFLNQWADEIGACAGPETRTFLTSDEAGTLVVDTSTDGGAMTSTRAYPTSAEPWANTPGITAAHLLTVIEYPTSRIPAPYLTDRFISDPSNPVRRTHVQARVVSSADRHEARLILDGKVMPDPLTYADTITGEEITVHLGDGDRLAVTVSGTWDLWFHTGFGDAILAERPPAPAGYAPAGYMAGIRLPRRPLAHPGTVTPVHRYCTDACGPENVDLDSRAMALDRVYALSTSTHHQ